MAEAACSISRAISRNASATSRSIAASARLRQRSAFALSVSTVLLVSSELPKQRNNSTLGKSTGPRWRVILRAQDDRRSGPVRNAQLNDRAAPLVGQRYNNYS